MTSLSLILVSSLKATILSLPLLYQRTNPPIALQEKIAIGLDVVRVAALVVGLKRVANHAGVDGVGTTRSIAADLSKKWSKKYQLLYACKVGTEENEIMYSAYLHVVKEGYQCRCMLHFVFES